METNIKLLLICISAMLGMGLATAICSIVLKGTIILAIWMICIIWNLVFTIISLYLTIKLDNQIKQII